MKQRYTYRIDEHETAEIERFSGNWYISYYFDGKYSSGASKFMDLEEAEKVLYRQRPTAIKSNGREA